MKHSEIEATLLREVRKKEVAPKWDEPDVFREVKEKGIAPQWAEPDDSVSKSLDYSRPFRRNKNT